MSEPTDHRGRPMGEHVNNHANKKLDLFHGAYYDGWSPESGRGNSQEAMAYDSDKRRYHLSVIKSYGKHNYEVSRDDGVDRFNVETLGTGRHSTRKRAQIAAESRALRSIEGRDMKTGKKKSS